MLASSSLYAVGLLGGAPALTGCTSAGGSGLSGVGPELTVGECLLDGGDPLGCRDGPCCVVNGARLGVRAMECDCHHASPGQYEIFTGLRLCEPPLPLCAPDGQVGLRGPHNRVHRPCVGRNPALWTVWFLVLSPEKILQHHTQSPQACVHRAWCLSWGQGRGAEGTLRAVPCFSHRRAA